MSEDYPTSARCIRFGEGRDRFRNSRKVLGVRKSIGARPGFCLSLVANDDVSVMENRLELSAEELRDKWSGKVNNECLINFCVSKLGHCLENGSSTLPAAAAFELSSSAEAAPCVRK